MKVIWYFFTLLVVTIASPSTSKKDLQTFHHKRNNLTHSSNSTLNNSSLEIIWLSKKNHTQHYEENQDVLISPGEYALKSLNLFFEELRGYVNDYTFKYQKFLCNLFQLRRRITRLIFFGKSPFIFTSEIDEKIKIVQNFFEVMIDSADKLDFYEKCNYTGAHLVYQMTQLKIRVLVLNFSYGRSETPLSQFNNIVLSHQCEFQDLEKECNKEQYMSYVVWKAYSEESNYTRRLLQVLLDQIDSEDQKSMSCD